MRNQFNQKLVTTHYIKDRLVDGLCLLHFVALRRHILHDPHHSYRSIILLLQCHLCPLDTWQWKEKAPRETKRRPVVVDRPLLFLGYRSPLQLLTV
jgi:hypothetical protein